MGAAGAGAGAGVGVGADEDDEEEDDEEDDEEEAQECATESCRGAGAGEEEECAGFVGGLAAGTFWAVDDSASGMNTLSFGCVRSSTSGRLRDFFTGSMRAGQVVATSAESLPT